MIAQSLWCDLRLRDAGDPGLNPALGTQLLRDYLNNVSESVTPAIPYANLFESLEEALQHLHWRKWKNLKGGCSFSFCQRSFGRAVMVA